MAKLSLSAARALLVVALAISTAFAFTVSPAFVTNSTKNYLKSSGVTALMMGFSDGIANFLGIGRKSFDDPCVMGDESIMSQKAHGTSNTPIQENLRWGCDRKVADNICNFNRHYAEYRGYWTNTNFIKEAKEEYERNGEIRFYDSNSGKSLFVAPAGRSFEDFIKESVSHGWPSFRDEEVVWENVRCLGNGETVSVDGTHLGHNLPDSRGSRYCINLVSIAGNRVN